MGKLNPIHARFASALVLLAFLVSGLGQLVAEAWRPEPVEGLVLSEVEGWQVNPTNIPFATSTEENLVTATYNPLTPTVTPFPATPTKSEGGGVGGLGVVPQFYLPLISRSEQIVLPTPTATPLPTLTAPPAPTAALSRYMSTDYIDSTNYNDLYNLGRQRGGCDGSPPRLNRIAS